MNKVREPIKKSSIAKKQTIIKKGFELICEKGYHNITCVDIAKYANVSTGIIYQYFNDKRDIFIEGIKTYSPQILYPMININDKEKIDKKRLKKILNKMIDDFLKTHTISKKAHEELIAMSHLDMEVAQILGRYEIDMTNKIANILEYNNFNVVNIQEKVHIIYGIIDNYCHEVVYHKHNSLDYKKMKDIVIEIIINTLLK